MAVTGTDAKPGTEAKATAPDTGLPESVLMAMHDQTPVTAVAPASGSGPTIYTGAGYTPQSGVQPPGTANPGTTSGNPGGSPGNLPSASQIISDTLSTMGLGGYGGAISAWVNSTISTLTGQGLAQDSIESYIEQNINNPTDPNTGQVNQQALAAFNAMLPGYNQRIQNGYGNGAPGGGPGAGIAAYVQYATQLNQYAQVAGLTPNTLNNDTAGELWANNVSASEVSSRITQGYVAAQQAMNALPGAADYFQSQGISTGGLASYFLNANNALTDLQMQQTLNQGIVAGESQATGFGALSQAQNATLSAFLASGNQSGLGGAGQVTTSAANNAFTSNLGENPGTGGSLGTAAQLAQGGYLTALPGQSTTGTLTQNTLLGAIEGNAADLAATAQAQQARTAGNKGGGGATTTAEGAVGLGFANQ